LGSAASLDSTTRVIRPTSPAEQAAAKGDRQSTFINSKQFHTKYNKG
jgi:hypothetical protein